MRGITRVMLWTLLASICFISRPAASSPQSGSGVQVDKSSIGGTVLNSEGDIPAINEPLAAAFLSPSQGWVAGENLKARTFSIEATTDGGRTWTTQYTTS